MAREATCELIEMAENGMISWETIARECLQYMSEDEVRDMAESNCWIDSEEDRFSPMADNKKEDRTFRPVSPE